MLKTMPGPFSPINGRRSKETDNYEINKSNKVDSKELEQNLSKINFSRTRFFTPEARVLFTHLKKALTKAPILYYFNLELSIRIEIDMSTFAISKIFSQLTLRYVTYTNPNLFAFKTSQWHLVGFFSKKMISA